MNQKQRKHHHSGSVGPPLLLPEMKYWQLKVLILIALYMNCNIAPEDHGRVVRCALTDPMTCTFFWTFPKGHFHVTFYSWVIWSFDLRKHVRTWCLATCLVLLATDTGTILVDSQGWDLCLWDIHVYCFCRNENSLLNKNCYQSPGGTNCGLEVDQNFS